MGDFNEDLETNDPNKLDRQRQILDFMAADGDCRAWSLTSNSTGATRRWATPLGFQPVENCYAEQM